MYIVEKEKFEGGKKMGLEFNSEFLWMIGCLTIAVLIGSFFIIRLKYKLEIKIALLMLLYIFLLIIAFYWNPGFTILFIIIDPIGIVYVFFQLKIAYQYLIGGVITLSMLIITIPIVINTSDSEFTGFGFRPDHVMSVVFFFATAILFYLGYKGLKELKQQNNTFRPVFKSK